MKKILLFAALPLVFASACDNTTTEQKIDAFENAIDDLSVSFSKRISEIEMNDELFYSGRMEEEKNKAYDEISGKLIDLVNTTVRKYPKDSVSLHVLNAAAKMFDDITVVEPAVNAISDIFKDDPLVVYLKESIAVAKNSGEGSRFIDFSVDHFIGNDAEGKPQYTKLSLSDFAGKGKYLLVDFWASWCGPCKQEIPYIADVYQKYAGDNFDVLSVAVWDNPEETLAAAQEHGIVWNQMNNAQENATSPYGINAIPHIMLIGPDGAILKRDLRGKQIEAAVAEALGR